MYLRLSLPQLCTQFIDMSKKADVPLYENGLASADQKLLVAHCTLYSLVALTC